MVGMWPGTSGTAAGPAQDGPGEAGRAEEGRAALEAACERMILEAVRLLQEGQLEQAEYLLSEGIGFLHPLHASHAMRSGSTKTAFSGRPC